jgi:hypothetical protein
VSALLDNEQCLETPVHGRRIECNADAAGMFASYGMGETKTGRGRLLVEHVDREKTMA